MKIKMMNGNEMELKEATKNNVVYVSHKELKSLAKEEGVMFDFPYIHAELTASAMCVVSNMQGMRCYGTGQAQTLSNATDLAFDNAMIDLYGIGAKSCVEYEISQTAKKAATDKIATTADRVEVGEDAAKKVAAEKEVLEATTAKKTIDDTTTREAEETRKVEEFRKAEETRKTEEISAKKVTQESAAKNDAPATQGVGYENDPDWAGCHSLTPNDPGDVIINYGPFKQTTNPSPLKPGPKYLSQVLKYMPEYIEKVVSIQPPAFAQRIPQFLAYCERQGIGLHAINSQAHDTLAQYGVKEL